MKHFHTLFAILLFSFFSLDSHQIQAQDFLETLVSSKNHSEFKAYTSDAKFLYKIEGEKLCVYSEGDKTTPIQTLTAETGYTIRNPFAITLSAEEDKIVIMSDADRLILTFGRNPDTGFLVLEETKKF